MKKWLSILLISLTIITIGLIYLFSTGGFDKLYPVIGQAVTPPVNATYSFGLIDLNAKDNLRVRENMKVASDNQGHLNLSVLDGRLLVNLLGNSNLTFKNVLFDQKNQVIKLDPKTSADLTTQQMIKKYPEILNSSISLTQEAIKPSDSSNDFLIAKPNKIVFDNFQGLVFLEIFNPIILQIDGTGALGNSILIRVVQTKNDDFDQKVSKEPVRILLLKPEKKKGVEGILYFGSEQTQEKFVVEVLSPYKNIYLVNKNHQLIFNKIPGQIDYEAISESDQSNLYSLLVSQKAWTKTGEQDWTTPQKDKQNKTQPNGNNTTFIKGFMEKQQQ
ncbi:hypothetical protein [Desulfovibrio litoralis]|uniref:Uncharacterized protein n=1 Tax=Desulfovibrio litoralis DSM 11393 TaxID=1121455 RepID=A0A1M7S8G4_9BACT|nr:hypothetical protein [Desulfovibrio litoralis]SHN54781.1 hypothetical protein SAMN02745728_00585 [Desulfovibrio litoralis DSM 11393]